MSIILFTDHTSTTTDTFQRFGEGERPDGMRMAEYNNLNSSVTVETLATCKVVTYGVKFPADLAKGVVREEVNFRMPMTPRADGSPRFCLMKATVFVPADSSVNEKTEFRTNLTGLWGSQETIDLITSFKTAI